MSREVNVDGVVARARGWIIRAEGPHERRLARLLDVALDALLVYSDKYEQPGAGTALEAFERMDVELGRLEISAPVSATSRAAQIREAYLTKRECYFGLVGTLYPSIVYAELMKLRDEYGGWFDLPYTPRPRPDGSAPPRPA